MQFTHTHNIHNNILETVDLTKFDSNYVPTPHLSPAYLHFSVIFFVSLAQNDYYL